MKDAPPSSLALDVIRQRIDACDDGILELLGQRLGLVAEVKAAKQADPTTNGMPLRPAREATVLRRLAKQASGLNIGPDLLVRLWPMIFADASMRQLPVTIHVPKKVSQHVGHRLRIRDYYATMPVEECRDEAQALVQVNANPNDIAIVEPDSNWVEAFLQGKAGKAQVIGCLPFVKQDGPPKLLVIGTTQVDATGDDETLVVSKGSLPREFSPAPLWQMKSGNFRISALPGYLSAEQSPLVGVTRSNPLLGLKLVGRFPAGLEM
jgi:chorismate mutase / prephenate dehydratase